MGTIFDPGIDYDYPVEQFESRMRSFPIDNDPTHFIERRVYKQDVRAYSRSPLGASMPGYTKAYIVSEGWIALEGNLLTFYIDYATIPATRREPETISYTFPGFMDRRSPFTEAVNAEVQYDYFFPGVSPGIGSISDIPVIKRQVYKSVGFMADYVEYLSGVTDPTIAEYEDMIDNEEEIVAEDSSRSVYLGPIVERRTPYIIAQ